MRRTALMFALAGMVGALVATPIAVYASHQFTDVSDSAFFSNSVTWMKDNGITVGCNPPANTKYCPNDNLTRGEMAVFLKRLSEKKVVDAATAVNADKLDGKSSGAFMTKNVYDSDSDGVVDLLPRAAFNFTHNAPDGSDFTLSTTITAPAPGILLLSAAVDVFNITATDNYQCWLQIDDGIVRGTFMSSRTDATGFSNYDEDCTTTGASAVDAGTYKIDFEVFSVTGSTLLGSVSVWALWVPLDGTGAIPTP